MNPQATIAAKDGTKLDASVVNLAKAIRTVESGGNYEARGASGEHGAYQWMPGNYEAGAKKYGIDPKDKNPINQDKVAYNTLKEWKDQGLTPAQIAAKWNSGSSTGWEKKVGTNKQGVKYDVPAYVGNVINAFRAVKAGQEPIGTSKPQPGGPDEPQAAQEGYKPWFEANPNDNPLMVGAKALGNVVPGVFNAAKGALSALNPINTLQNLAAIPGAFQEAVAANKGSVGTTLGRAATSLPGEAVGAFGLRPALQGVSGVAGYLTGDRIGKGEDLAPAANAFTENPFGSALPVVIAARMGAGAVDSATAAIDAARMKGYVSNIGKNTAEGVPIPRSIATSLEPKVEAAVTGIARPVMGAARSVFGRASEAVSPTVQPLSALEQQLKDLKAGAAKVSTEAEKAAYSSKIGEVQKAIETHPERTAAGKVVQGEVSDAALAARTLPKIDTAGVKTYSDLSGRLQSRITEDLAKVDKEYAASKTRTKLAKLKTTVESDVGGVKASAQINYVEEALKGLQELYFKTKDPASLARIKAVAEQARRQGLTADQINRIAREYGTEFGKKAFSARTGDPLTSTNAQAFENVRTGVKETARGFLKTDAAKALDKGVADMIKVKKLVDDMAEKVNKLEQRVTKRNVIEKVGRALGTAVDMATFGGLKAFVARIFPSNVGLKVQNSIDLQNQLSSNLELLKSLEKMDDASFSTTFAGIIKRAAGALNQLPEARVSTQSPYVFGGQARELAQ